MDDDAEIKRFTPKSLEKPEGIRIQSFKPRDFSSREPTDYSQVKEKFGSFAVTDKDLKEPKSSRFELYPESKKLLGVDREERGQVQEVIRQEVEGQIQALKDSAYQEGFSKGLSEGREQGLNEMKAVYEPKIELISEALLSLEQSKQKVFESTRSALIELVFQMTKQIILREIKHEPDYVSRLVSELVERMGIKESVRVVIHPELLDQIESIKSSIRERFSELKNIQIEARSDVPLGGCRIESEWSRVDATLEHQFQAIESILKENSSLSTVQPE